MRIKRFAAIASAVGAIGAVAAPVASAGPPNYNAARAVCTEGFVDAGAAGYGCLSGPELTQGQSASGQAVCEHAYGGSFIVRPSGYVCSLT